MKIHEKIYKCEKNDNKKEPLLYEYDPWKEWNEEAREVYDACPDNEEIEICYQDYIPSGKIAFTCEDFEDTTFPWHERPKGDFVDLLLELKTLMDEEYPRTNKDVEELAKKYPNAFREFYRTPIVVKKVEDMYAFFIMFDGRHRALVASQLDIDLPVKVMSYKKKSEISFEEYCDKALFGPWKFFDREGNVL